MLNCKFWHKILDNSEVEIMIQVAVMASHDDKLLFTYRDISDNRNLWGPDLNQVLSKSA